MRYLRMAAIVVFAAALVLNIMGNAKYRAQQDTTPPVISGDAEPLELTVEQGMEALKQGLTARDDRDGDITADILVASTSYFVEKGTMNVKYVVFDSSHNAGLFQRQVIFTDYKSPRFALTQPLVFPRGSNIRVLSYVTASDCLDGDITGQITQVSGQISNYTPGSYPVVLEVSNSHGDRVQVQLNVVITDPTQIGPEILLKAPMVYIEKDSRFNPDDMVDSVRAQLTGQHLSLSRVSVLGQVDTSIPGCYQLTYLCTHEGKEGYAYLTVVVEED